MAIIRRIEEQDCQQEFQTGKRVFDFDPSGIPLDLHIYLERDRSGNYESYVLVENSNVVAILCIQFRKNALYLSRIGVKESSRLKGYGKQLMEFAVQKAMEKGFRKITLEAQSEVIRFFEDIGFVVKRRYADTYWGNSATMELSW